MLEEHDKRDKTNIINLIGRRSNKTANFALLIGSGASSTSGVKTSSQMIAEWRRQLYEQCKSKESFEKWLQKQDWFEDDEEYSILFEKVCDQRSQRRIYIEGCVKDAKPSWGYIYLANIIAHGYFNIIFTPNFDDLLNEACFLYADLRPLVCAHDSAVADIRVTSARPKIIKLHGDFLYDSIKNTVIETETLEKNMRDKFMQFAREYGLVVVGYGGNDRSIMDVLDILLRSEGYFPNGLYWCRRKKSKVNTKLQRLMRQDRAYWVEIDGFDEFMAELHRGLGLTLPIAVYDPYRATTERLNSFISVRKDIKHPIITADIKGLEEKVREFEHVLSGEAPSEEFDRLAPYRFLGDIEADNKNYPGTLLYYEKALFQSPDDLSIMGNLVLGYIWTEQFEKALEMSQRMISQAPGEYLGYYWKGRSLSYLGRDRIKEAIVNLNEALKHAGKEATNRVTVLTSRSNTYLVANNWDKALSDAEEALQLDAEEYAALLNKCIALKKLDNKKMAEKILKDNLPKIEDKYLRACAFSTLGNKVNMLKELKTAIKEDNKYRMFAKYDPDFEEYREDPDFRKYVYDT